MMYRYTHAAISFCISAVYCVVGAPCSTTGDIRLVGGVDEFQGRVEVCSDAGIYSTVCSAGWDNRDAQVVCRQLGFNGRIHTGYGTSIA